MWFRHNITFTYRTVIPSSAAIPPHNVIKLWRWCLLLVQASLVQDNLCTWFGRGRGKPKEICEYCEVLICIYFFIIVLLFNSNMPFIYWIFRTDFSWSEVSDRSRVCASWNMNQTRENAVRDWRWYIHFMETSNFDFLKHFFFSKNLNFIYIYT